MHDLHLVAHPIRDSTLQSEHHRGGSTTLKITVKPINNEEFSMWDEKYHN